MKLERHPNLPKQIKHKHEGPKKGGTFWALAGKNDLPTNHPLAQAELSEMLKRGRVWIQDVTQPNTWQEVSNVSDLPDFKSGIDLDYENPRATVEPFQPEFYFLPRCWRGKRLVRRAEHRAFVKYAGYGRQQS